MTRIDRADAQIPAPPEKVYAAWTDPDLLKRWLPPKGARLEVHQLDPRPGGVLRMTLHFDAGPGKTGEGRDDIVGLFSRCSPPGARTLAIDFPSDRPEFGGTMLMEWTFAPVPGGSHVSVACHHVPPGIEKAGHETALAGSLAQLRDLFA